jgi:hypothetical protein
LVYKQRKSATQHIGFHCSSLFFAEDWLFIGMSGWQVGLQAAAGFGSFAPIARYLSGFQRTQHRKFASQVLSSPDDPPASCEKWQETGRIIFAFQKLDDSLATWAVVACRFFASAPDLANSNSS